MMFIGQEAEVPCPLYPYPKSEHRFSPFILFDHGDDAHSNVIQCEFCNLTLVIGMNEEKAWLLAFNDGKDICDEDFAETLDDRPGYKKCKGRKGE